MARSLDQRNPSINLIEGAEEGMSVAESILKIYIFIYIYKKDNSLGLGRWYSEIQDICQSLLIVLTNRWGPASEGGGREKK